MSQGKDEPTGAHRVAAFLLSLDKARQAEILKHMDRATLSKVAQAMTELDERTTSPTSVRDLYLDLARSVSSPKTLQTPREDELEGVLTTTLGPELAGQIVSEIHERRCQARPFSDLEKHGPDPMAVALADEPTQIVAIVLIHLDPETSAGVLANYEPERALEIVRSMASIKEPSKPVLNCLVQTMTEKIRVLGAAPAPTNPSESLKTIAQMLTFTPQETEQAVLEGIESENEQMASDIRDFMFTWDDLASVDKRAMQSILSTVDTKTLAMALKGCPISVEENIISNLSSRVQEMVLDERDLLGAVTMSDIEAGRGELLKGVRSLMETGEFKPARAGEELIS